MTAIEPTGTISGEKPQPEKKSRGNPLWQPGQSGNPAGRPKGIKNKLTILKEAVLEEVEENLLTNWSSIVAKTIELANEGDTTCLKIVWDRMMPAKRAIEAREGTEDRLNIVIEVTGMGNSVREIGGEVIEDGEFVE